MKLHIQLRPLPGSALVQSYLSRDPESLSFFAGDPFALESFRGQWEHVRARFPKQKRAAAAEMLRPTTDAARSKIAKFVRDGGAVITTGQQAGLFTGPLYTIYKAVTAVRLAEVLEAALGITVIPVFWTASEDHDWAEVNHAYVVDRRDNLRRIDVPSTETRPLPMAERRFDSSIETAVESLSQAVAGAEYQTDIMRMIRTAYVPGTTVASAFADIVAALFSQFDLAMTDAADPMLKAASVPVLRRELASRAEHEAMLHLSAEQLEQQGFTPQVPILPAASNVFFRTEYGRERLFFEAGRWVSRDSGRRFATTDLEKLLAVEPERFSPNVLLRPIVESSVFPVLASVAGPGEIAYFAQLRSLFDEHGAGMPLIYPRASLVLTEERVQRYLTRTGVTTSELRMPQHQLVRQRSVASLPPDIEAALRELRANLTEGFDHVAHAAGQLDPTLGKAIGTRRNRALLTVAEAEQKILRAIARGQHDWIKEVDAARNQLAPLGSEQERVLNVLPFLADHGLALLAALAAAIPVRWSDAPEARAADVAAAESLGDPREL